MDGTKKDPKPRPPNRMRLGFVIFGLGFVVAGLGFELWVCPKAKFRQRDARPQVIKSLSSLMAKTAIFQPAWGG